MPKVYAFDVDETLQISNGPVTLQSLMDLRIQGHIVGICGNLKVFCDRPGWQHLSSFLMNYDTFPRMKWGMHKADWLIIFRDFTCVGMDEYILVGNEFGQDNGMGFIGQSHDGEEARAAGWRFIKEIDFFNGAR